MRTTSTQILFISLFLFAITSSQAALLEAVKNNDVTKVEYALKSNINVNEQDDDGFTPLIYATCNFRTDEVLDRTATDSDNLAINLAIVKLLLESEADVNNSGKTGSTPLIWAAQFGNPAVVVLLLTNEANVNEKNSSGHGPLTCAVKRCYFSLNQKTRPLEIVNTLFQHPSIKNSAVEEALEQSFAEEYNPILKIKTSQKDSPEKEQIIEKMLQKLPWSFKKLLYFLATILIF